MISSATGRVLFYAVSLSYICEAWASSCAPETTQITVFLGDSLMRQSYAYAASVALGVNDQWPEKDQDGYQVGGFSLRNHPKRMKEAESILGSRVDKRSFKTKAICRNIDSRFYTLPGCKVFAYTGVRYCGRFARATLNRFRL